MPRLGLGIRELAERCAAADFGIMASDAAASAAPQLGF
jgi:hypothetical protein